MNMRPFRQMRRHSQCVSSICRGPQEPHGECVCHCGQVTCTQTQLIDPETLRRRRFFIVDWSGNHPVPLKYEDARKRRTERDWLEMSEPINAAGLLLNTMGEQFPGEARRLLRAFIASGSTRAEVEGVTAGVLMTSIESLGLGDQVYAESRGNKTVLRRVAAVA